MEHYSWRHNRHTFSLAIDENKQSLVQNLRKTSCRKLFLFRIQFLTVVGPSVFCKRNRNRFGPTINKQSTQQNNTTMPRITINKEKLSQVKNLGNNLPKKSRKKQQQKAGNEGVQHLDVSTCTVEEFKLFQQRYPTQAHDLIKQHFKDEKIDPGFLDAMVNAVIEGIATHAPKQQICCFSTCDGPRRCRSTSTPTPSQFYTAFRIVVPNSSL